jgi:hypothetical protein
LFFGFKPFIFHQFHRSAVLTPKPEVIEMLSFLAKMHFLIFPVSISKDYFGVTQNNFRTQHLMLLLTYCWSNKFPEKKTDISDFI